MDLDDTRPANHSTKTRLRCLGGALLFVALLTLLVQSTAGAQGPGQVQDAEALGIGNVMISDGDTSLGSFKYTSLSGPLIFLPFSAIQAISPTE